MNQRTTWVVSDVFYPESFSSTGYFMTSIAEYLAKYSNISVITASQNVKYKLKEKEVYKKMNIYRVNNNNLNKNNLIQRLLKLITLTIKLSFKLLFKIKNGDQIFCVTNPAFIILMIPLIKKIKKNIKISILVYDVFPENLSATDIWNKNSFLYKITSYFFNYSYSQFDNIITIGRDMKEVFKQKISKKNHHRIKFITNWAETNKVQPLNKNKNNIIKKLKLQNKIVIQFAGNIGRAQGLEELVSVFSKCENKIFHFLFIGDGAILNKLKQYINKNQIKNITFLGSLPRSEQNNFLNACDIGLVTLRQNMYGLGVPSKSYNILSAGKPILCISNPNSEIAMMIKSNNVGWVLDNNELNKIPKLFQKIYREKNKFDSISNNCRKLAMMNYSKKVILEKYKNLLI